MIAWTGRNAVRAAFLNGRADRRAAVDLAPIAAPTATATTASPTSPCRGRERASS